MSSTSNANSTYPSKTDTGIISEGSYPLHALSFPPPPLPPPPLPPPMSSTLPFSPATYPLPQSSAPFHGTQPQMHSFPPVQTFQQHPPLAVLPTSLPPPPLPCFSNFSTPPPSITNFNFQNNKVAAEEEQFKILKQRLEMKFEKSKKEKNHLSNIKVSQIKQQLVDSVNHIKQLESLANCLQLTYKSISDSEWFKYCNEAQNIKSELSSLMENMDDTSLIELLKKSVALRKKKRTYRKRKAKEWQEQKREAKLFTEQEHRRIDFWLENMKDQVERAKREEDIKREADLVLGDVTAKKAEAKRMLNLLNSLAKLRTARAQNTFHGKASLECDSKAFVEIIDRLKKMWIDQINGYKVEEHGLKVMLGHAEEEKSSIEAAKFRKNLKMWYQWIFGSSAQSFEPQTLDELLKKRHDWDRFVCAEDIPMASRIPVGWVLPCEPSSEEWAALLQAEA